LRDSIACLFRSLSLSWPDKNHAPAGLRIEWMRVLIVATFPAAAIAANVIANLRFPAVLDEWPIIGLAVWAAILATALLGRPDWSVMPETFKGTVFLLALVTSASMMPVEELPKRHLGIQHSALASFPQSSTISR
jgi:hypothetical protein